MVGAEQVAEAGTGGHQDGAAVGAGDQRAYLRGEGGVVQYHQHPAPGQQGTETRRQLLRPGWHAARRFAQCPQPSAQHVRRRLRCRVGSAQVGVELAVGEVVGHQVAGLHGQCGLAQAAGPGDGGDRHLAREAGVAGQQLGQLAQLLAPAGEVGDHRGQLCRADRRRGCRCRRPGGCAVRVGRLPIVVSGRQVEVP
ncbi:hypothetical protein BIV25_42960 [Streptomyces sp. MUSC 14]|nr:hypothetical protein BIV25_42960 [Streptomyces sp. MUSC 14]